MKAEDKSEYNNIRVGDSFGKWRVVGSPLSGKPIKVPCECVCGSRYDVDAYNLVKGKSKSCKPCALPRVGVANPSWKGYEEIPNSWFLRFKRYSKHTFTLRIEDVWGLFVQQGRKCALTGLPISFANERVRGRKYNGICCTASIDRIDSSKGYTKDNVQLVHKDVNMMKNHYDQSYFIEVCRAVVNYSKSAYL